MGSGLIRHYPRVAICVEHACQVSLPCRSKSDAMASTVDALGNLTGVIVLSSSEIPTGLDRFANGRTVTIVKLSGAKLASLHVCPFERVADLKQALREKVGVPGFFDLLHGTVKLEPRQSLEENLVPDGATFGDTDWQRSGVVVGCEYRCKHSIATWT